MRRPPLIILDGPMGTELDRRGVDVTLPLWSARAVVDAPDVMRAIHIDHLRAGARVITANTFRTTPRTIGRADPTLDAADLTTRAVEIARTARNEAAPSAQVVGSIAPLEDCYEPDRAPDEATCAREHAEQIEILLAAGVDAVLIETMNAAHEARAAAAAAARLAPGRWMISFCLRADGEPGVLLSGESVETVGAGLDGASAIGVNCVAAPSITPHVRWLADRAASRQRVLAYGNVGRPDAEKGWVNTDAVDPDRYAAYAQEWRDAGASMIGGCCGTTVATITRLRAKLTS